MYKKAFDPQGLKHQFAGIDAVDHNYSQADQDIFVLSILDGKRQGTYLEIGCGRPFEINNTALLETQFDWRGVSIDLTPMYTDLWPGQRKNPAVCADGARVDYIQLLDQHHITTRNLDYLSLDCDPPDQSFAILKTIPFDLLKFAVITFEHDCYAYGADIKTASRQYLQDQGYMLVGADISEHGMDRDFEDWYVHPELVNLDRVELYKNLKSFPKDYTWFLYERIADSVKNTTFAAQFYQNTCK